MTRNSLILRDEDRDVDLSFAPISLRLDTENINREERSMSMTLVTENGVDTYDWETGDIIREVILISGVEWPKQVPLLDSHNRYSASGALGSVRQMAKTDDAVTARAFFSSKPAAVEVFNDVADGHITDVSVGARRLASTFIPKGETRRVGGKDFTGPTRVVTRSRIMEGSVVTIGADSKAKFSPVQRAYMDPQGLLKERAMEKWLRDLCVERGMSADLSDEDARKWAQQHLPGLTQRSEATPPANPPATPPSNTAPAGDVERQLATAREEATRIERKRVADIRTLCRAAVLLDAEATANDLIDRGISADAAPREILDIQGKQKGAGPANPGGSNTERIEHTGSEAESVRKAVGDGLILRSAGEVAVRTGQKLHYDDSWKPHPGANEFRGRRLVEVIRMLIERSGAKHSHLSDTEVAERALGADDPNAIYRTDNTPMYNVAGMFSAVTLDVSNNELRKSYMEANQSFTKWARKGANFTDFKERYKSILGEISDPGVVPENDDFKEVTYSDAKENYHVEVYAQIFSITYQAILNNDLNGFTDAPRKMGNAFKRKNNRIVVGILTANDLLADGYAIFDDTNHVNIGTSAVIGKSSLDEMFGDMMLRTGLNSNVICGFTPRYVLMPPGIAGNALEFFGSRSVAINTAGNSGTVNIYGPGGARPLEPIVEPLLAATDVNAWYGIADYNEVDTVEYAYLDGFELPVVQQERPFNRLGLRFSVVQGFGAKCLDYRGLYYNAGA